MESLQPKKKKKRNKKFLCHFCRRQNIKAESKKCSGCGLARYCDVVCQNKDWKRHQSKCRIATVCKKDLQYKHAFEFGQRLTHKVSEVIQKSSIKNSSLAHLLFNLTSTLYEKTQGTFLVNIKCYMKILKTALKTATDDGSPSSFPSCSFIDSHLQFAILAHLQKILARETTTKKSLEVCDGVSESKINKLWFEIEFISQKECLKHVTSNPINLDFQNPTQFRIEAVVSQELYKTDVHVSLLAGLSI